MSTPENYWVIEYKNKAPVKIYSVNVGVRHIGLNNAVRSIMAFNRFELERFAAAGMWAPRPFSFDVKSQSQFDMLCDHNELVRHCLYEKSVIECASPRELYAHIGYNPTRKAYDSCTLADA